MKVVSFGSLSEFLGEAWFGVLRLSQSTRMVGGGGIPEKEFNLDLTATEGPDTIHVLHWSRGVNWAQGGPAWPREATLVACLWQMEDLVREFLIQEGYTVRPGIHLLPDGIRPHRGEFDCLKWSKPADDTGESWGVELVSGAEWSEIVREQRARWGIEP